MEDLKKDHKSDKEFKQKKEKFEADTAMPELENMQAEMAWLKMTLGEWSFFFRFCCSLQEIWNFDTMHTSVQQKNSEMHIQGRNK